MTTIKAPVAFTIVTMPPKKESSVKDILDKSRNWKPYVISDDLPFLPMPPDVDCYTPGRFV